MKHVIEVIARGLLVKEGQILVCHNAENRYAYLPGGHVEFWETCEQALCREWQEELACECRIESYLRHFEDFFTDAAGEKHHEYAFLYRVSCEMVNLQQPIPHPEPNLFFEWFPLNEVHRRNILPLDLRDYILTIC